MIRLFLVFTLVTLSCNNRATDNRIEGNVNHPSPAQGKALMSAHEVRLGNSNYFLQLPDTLRISEARGKEGQLFYNIIPNDTIWTNYLYIQTKRGYPIGDPNSLRKESSYFATSALLGKQVEWRVIRGKGGYFWVFTTEDGDINATIFAENRARVDSFISLVGTLRLK